MSVVGETALGPTRTVTVLRLPHRPARVWRALTEPERPEAWLLPVVGGKPEKRAAFTFEGARYYGWKMMSGRRFELLGRIT